MAEATQTRKQAARIQAGDFLALPETNLPTELLDGEVIVTPAPSDEHQHTTYELAKYVEKLADGGIIRLSPIDLVFDEENVVQPDIFWVSPDNTGCHRGDDGRWRGAPDLVIAVLSPATAQKDKVRKFRLYEKHGVREYWIVDPIGQYVEVFTFVEGAYRLAGVFGPDEWFESAALGGVKVDLKKVFGP